MAEHVVPPDLAEHRLKLFDNGLRNELAWQQSVFEQYWPWISNVWLQVGSNKLQDGI